MAGLAVDWGEESAPQRMVLRNFRPLAKGTFRGFATIELPCGLGPIDLPVFISRGGPWTALPRRPERRQKLDANGQPSFQAVAEWHSRDLARLFSTAAVTPVWLAHPGALDRPR